MFVEYSCRTHGWQVGKFETQRHVCSDRTPLSDPLKGKPDKL